MKSEEFLFVYNADSGLFNAVLDSLHKVFSPATYNCNLCALTYSSVRMKKEWKSFINRMPFSATFLHRNELLKQYPDSNFTYPSLLKREGSTVHVLIEAEEMNQIKSLEHLMTLVRRKI